MHHKGKVVSRTELIEHIYDQDFDRDSNAIEVFVTRIRKKLGAEVIDDPWTRLQPRRPRRPAARLTPTSERGSEVACPAAAMLPPTMRPSR